MIKEMILLFAVAAVVVAYPQGGNRVRRYYYNEDRDMDTNSNTHRTSGVKGGHRTQGGNTYSGGPYDQGTNRQQPSSGGQYDQGTNRQQPSSGGPYDQGTHQQRPSNGGSYDQVTHQQQQSSGQGIYSHQPTGQSYGQGSNGQSSFSQSSDPSYDQGRDLYRQAQTKGQHRGGYKEHGY